MRFSAAALFLGLGSLAYAQVPVAVQCPGSGVCYSMNIPQETASDGTGDVFFQMTAPTSFSWVGMGQGDGMIGANIFVMYTDPTGENITLSPRLATAHKMPLYNSHAEVTLLEGSGVSNGTMTANFKCSNCNKWQGGSMDFSQSSGSFIYAALPGDPVRGGPTASISEHSVNGDLSLNFQSAKGGSSVNPFQNFSAAHSSSSGGDDLLAAPSDFFLDPDMYLKAHGILASLAFVVLFPLGAIIIRVLSFPGLVWIHAAFQVFAYMVYIAAFGIGVYIANSLEYTDKYAHPIIGIVVLALIFFQPILGYLHHLQFKRQGKRSFWSYAHIWLGRIVITLGIVNGGLGLQLADNSNSGKIAYGVVAGIIWLAWAASAVYGEIRRLKQPKTEKGISGPPGGQTYHAK